MSETQVVDVLIVGAGPVGLTLACDLCRRGIACRIVDQEATYHTGRAAGLSPRTQEVFDDLGLLELIAAYDAPIPWRFYDRDNRVVRELVTAAATPPATPDVPYPGTLHVGQRQVEAVLRAHLAAHGRRVELGRRMVGFIQRSEHVEASVQHAGGVETIRARYMVGCDGGHSAVRKGAGIAFEGETRPNAFTLAGVMRVDGLAPTCRHIWRDLEGESQLSLTPRIEDGAWNLVLSTTLDEEPNATAETVQRIFDQRVGMHGVRISDPTWVSVHQANRRMVERYRSGRVLLAGDAAHVGLFFGMQTGIQDAYNLGWKLAGALRGAPDALLDTYQAERLPVARYNLSAGGAAAGARTVANAMVSRGADAQQQSAPAFPDPVIFSQLGVTYRGSPLAHDLDDATGIRAGDRAPDAPCVRAASGAPVRLFDLFRGTHFTLLVFCDHAVPRLPDRYDDSVRAYAVARADGMAARHEGAVVDGQGHAARAYGVVGDATILVRPDGYVGLTGRGGEPRPLVDYLRAVIGG